MVLPNSISSPEWVLTRKSIIFQVVSSLISGMGILSRKNNLGKNLMLFRRKFPDDYEFFPITWHLPEDFEDLKAYH